MAQEVEIMTNGSAIKMNKGKFTRTFWLFLSLGMYDSENIIVPIIMSLISGIWVLFVANRMENEK